jgi:protein SCO1/2
MRLRKAAATLLAAIALFLAAPLAAGGRYAMKGFVVQVDPSRRSFVVSHDAIPAFMEAMTMPFDVRDPKELDGVAPGMTVEFTLVIDADNAYVERVRIVKYDAAEQDPFTAQRLAQLKQLMAPSEETAALAIGATVPDFTLIDQTRQPVTLSSFRGQVVAVNFIYTTCALPQFCFRIANHFGVIQRRFSALMGKGLVLLTVTFDPARDSPEQLAEYAKRWNPNPSTWHFLTGEVPDVARVCSLFGVQAYRDDGLFNHSSRTAVIDRQGRLAASIEGNQYTTDQLASLIDAATKQR